MLRAVVPATAEVFGRAVVMPNLVPPVRTASEAAAYRQRVLDAVPLGRRFEPLMALYLTDATTPEDIREARAAEFVVGYKLYPAHATTHAAHGVTDVAALAPVFETMEQVDLPLLVHGEDMGPDIDVFDREKVFIERTLAPLVARYPRLRVVLEHITTKEGVDFVKDAGEQVAGTLTAHHLLLDRNALFAGGLRPHHYCLPVLKRQTHQRALRDAACSGHPRFFLGTDSAPHPIHEKESARCCAGLYTAPTAIALYARVFDEEQALPRLAGFAAHHGQRFYRLPPNPGRIRLVREPTPAPARVFIAPGVEVLPFHPEDGLGWRFEVLD